MSWLTLIFIIAFALICTYSVYLNVYIRDLKSECDHLKTLLPKHGKDGRFISRK